MHLAVLENPGFLGCGYRSYSRETLFDTFLHARTQTYGITEQGIIVAALLYGEPHFSDHRDFAYLFRLRTVAGKGLGKLLLGHAIYEAQAAHISRIHLDVDARNPARHLYEHVGFEGTSALKHSQAGKLISMSLVRPQFDAAIEQLNPAAKAQPGYGN